MTKFSLYNISKNTFYRANYDLLFTKFQKTLFSAQTMVFPLQGINKALFISNF